MAAQVDPDSKQALFQDEVDQVIEFADGAMPADAAITPTISPSSTRPILADTVDRILELPSR